MIIFPGHEYLPSRAIGTLMSRPSAIRLVVVVVNRLVDLGRHFGSCDGRGRGHGGWRGELRDG